MNEREPDDTPEQAERERRAGGSHSYYYDDGTGYELFDPDEDNEGEEQGGESTGGGGDQGSQLSNELAKIKTN